MKTLNTEPTSAMSSAFLYQVTNGRASLLNRSEKLLSEKLVGSSVEELSVPALLSAAESRNRIGNSAKASAHSASRWRHHTPPPRRGARACVPPGAASGTPVTAPGSGRPAAGVFMADIS